MYRMDEVASQGELYSAAKKINDLKVRTLFVFEYLSGGRVGEIIKRCQKKNIEYVKRFGDDWLLIRLPYTEKNKEHPSRIIPVSVTLEKRFVDLMTPYLDSLNDDDVIFNISRTTAWRKIRPIVATIKEIGGKKHRHKNANHYLRHCRATHFVELYDCDMYDLIKLFGWSDGRPSETYVNKSVNSIMKKLIKMAKGDGITAT